MVVLGVLLAAATLASCSSAPEEQRPRSAASSSPTTTDPTIPASSPTGPEGEAVLEVWFTRGDRLFLTHRTVPETLSVARASVEALLEGPTAEEAGHGVTSSIPPGTRLLDIGIAGSTATVDLSGEYESGGGSASMFGRLAQVVFTVTQFASVEDVSLRIDGETVEVFSSEGIVLDGPQTRDDYEGQMPAIVVTSPHRDEEVGRTITIAGTANVFEATVSIKIVTTNGDVLAETFTTATCGSGCRGDFTAEVPVEVSDRTEAIVRVFESSAEDGRPTNVVKVPVTIVP